MDPVLKSAMESLPPETSDVVRQAVLDSPAFVAAVNRIVSEFIGRLRVESLGLRLEVRE